MISETRFGVCLRLREDDGQTGSHSGPEVPFWEVAVSLTKSSWRVADSLVGRIWVPHTPVLRVRV